ncbi:MAG: maleylpyruvate isomerase family mycothiol-dependent enzyme [Leucobacter sp.]
MSEQRHPVYDDRIEALEIATGGFAELLARASGDEAVPGCPGWSVRDLGLHLGTVHRWAASIVLSGRMQREPEPLVRVDLASWYPSAAGALVAALRAVDPDEPTPNFARLYETAAFWPRRQLHEVTVHAFDLAQALGLPEPVLAPELAADGVDELLTVFFPRLVARGSAPDVRDTVRLSALDTGDAWVVGPGEIPNLLPPETRAAASIEGSAADLYLALWGRVPADRLAVTGDAAGTLLAGPTSV